MDYFDRKGQPIDYEKFLELFNDPEYKMVKQDNVNNYFISTVWLGLNHNFKFLFTNNSQDGPVIFETMVFDSNASNRWTDIELQRYSTEEEALFCHQEFVEKYSNLPPHDLDMEAHDSDS